MPVRPIPSSCAAPIDPTAGLPFRLPPGRRCPTDWCVHASSCWLAIPILSHPVPSSLPPCLCCLPGILLSLPLSGNIPLSALRTRTRGPAYNLPPLPAGASLTDIDPSSESYDPLDEVLELFRANTFFRNFEIKGPADRLLIYGILFIQECLGKIRASMAQGEAQKVRCFSGRENFVAMADTCGIISILGE